MSEPEKSLGNLHPDELARHDFLIQNNGNAPLRITDVRPGCACAFASFDKTIAPGQTGKVHTTIDLLTYKAPVAKSFTVTTNDEAHAVIILTIRADVTPRLMVVPAAVNFIVQQGSDRWRGKLTSVIAATDDTSFNVVGVTTSPGIIATFQQATPAQRIRNIAGKQWAIEIGVDSGHAVGPLADFVKVTTDHPIIKFVEIPVSGYARPLAQRPRLDVDTGLIVSLHFPTLATKPLRA